MLSIKEAAMMYETLLSSPGMNDAIKISITIPRKNVLLVCRLIERGFLLKEDERDGLLNLVREEKVIELSAVCEELLQKAGLKDMNDKLNLFTGK
jgi:hypothetical protein